MTWIVPALAAFFLYGLGQGLVKKYVGEVSPARFCLFFVIARSVVGLIYCLVDWPQSLSSSQTFLAFALGVYLLDGAGWILYYRSILSGPITIVGTLSAAYPALTVLLAAIFLGERLSAWQSLGVALVLGGCIGLSYSPPDPEEKSTSREWIPLASMALICWGCGQTLLKYAYGLPGASESKAMLGMIVGGWLTLGFYGLKAGGRRGGEGASSGHEWRRAMLPMGMMAAGDAAVILATRLGPVMVVAPLTAAYPVVTIAFARVALKEHISYLQYGCVAATLAGMLLCTQA